jgi:hypothetical protein
MMGDFTYDKSWEQIEDMLNRAIRKQNMHLQMIQKTNGKERIKHMRNYKALEGVVKSLKWVLGDTDIEHPLE